MTDTGLNLSSSSSFMKGLSNKSSKKDLGDDDCGSPLALVDSSLPRLKKNEGIPLRRRSAPSDPAARNQNSFHRRANTDCLDDRCWLLLPLLSMGRRAPNEKSRLAAAGRLSLIYQEKLFFLVVEINE